MYEIKNIYYVADVTVRIHYNDDIDSDYLANFVSSWRSAKNKDVAEFLCWLSQNSAGTVRNPSLY